jgi:hypothetical protein
LAELDTTTILIARGHGDLAGVAKGKRDETGAGYPDAELRPKPRWIVFRVECSILINCDGGIIGVAEYSGAAGTTVRGNSGVAALGPMTRSGLDICVPTGMTALICESER